MPYIKTLEPGPGQEQLTQTYDMLNGMFGMVPQVFTSQSLRPDLLEPIVLFVKRLMVEDHGLPRSTKELLAAYVSKLNSCAY